MSVKPPIRWKKIFLITLGVPLLCFVSLLLFISFFGVSITRPTPASQHLRGIAHTYYIYQYAGPTPRTLTVPPGSSAHAAALVFASSDSALNDASFYFIKQDPTYPAHPPKQVARQFPDGSWELTPEFAHATLAWVIAANISPTAPYTSTPVAWTRGLRADGTWSADSPWKGTGGHIAYLDGHVEWFDQLSATRSPENSFVLKYGTDEPTVNIREALPPGAVILSAEPRPPPKP